jgi:taurine dioxygenase
MQIKPYSSAIGAEILGPDLTRSLPAEELSVIHQALLEHHVLFFRDQDLSPQQQIQFSHQLGELEDYPFARGMDGHPEIVEVVKLPTERVNFGSGWHVDMSFNPSAPVGAALYAIEIPPAGGDTLFSNLTLAYETLSDGYREMLDLARGVHDSGAPGEYRSGLAGMKIKPSESRKTTVHDLSREHPETGRRSLFISPDYCTQLEDMSREESATLLTYLEQHATRHEFTCRFRWTPGTLVLWDNRCIMHRAIEDDLGARTTGEGFKRVLHRTTFKSFFPLSTLQAAAVGR